MIEKERTVPLEILQNDALIRRLSKDYPKKGIIESKSSMLRAGFWGEKEVDYYLRLLSKEKYHFLRDLRLPYEDTFFQIDSFILTTCYGYIVEAKNYAGTLTIDNKFNQLIQENEDKIIGYKNPVLQAKQHMLQLKKFLKDHHIPDFPIEYQAAFSNPKAILKTTSNQTSRISHSHSVIDEIEKLDKRFTIEKISKKDIKKISKLLVKNHTSQSEHILEQYNIPAEDILKGVFCEKCSSEMMYKWGKWYCLKCPHTSKNAHQQAIMDYFLIFKPTIINSEARSFLKIPSRRVIQHLLVSMNLPFEGVGKARVYFSKTVPRH